MRVALGFAITLFVVFHALQWYPTADGRLLLVSQLDNILYDIRLRMTITGGRDDRIAILGHRRKKLAEVRRWPWSRRDLAEFTDKLFDRYGVALVGFDLVLAEREPSSGLEMLEELARGEPAPAR